jgi:predicted HTH transcriptional regulator
VKPFWQSHILGKWKPVFQFLPVENIFHASQQAYYDAINASSEKANCAPFIDFMLGEIHRTLDSRKGEPKGAAIGINIGIIIGLNIGINDTQKQILLLVKENRAITAAQLAGRICIAQRNIETNLAQLKKTGLLRRVGAKRNGHWELISQKEPGHA